MMIYVAIVLGLVAVLAAILVRFSLNLLEYVNGIMANLAYMHILLQAVDHKVSKQFGWKDGKDEYIDELVQQYKDKEQK